MMRPVTVFVLAVAAGAGAVAARAGAPAAQPPPFPISPAASAPASPPLMLPAGGAEFRRAVLGWTALPAPSMPGDLLEMPVEATRLSSRFGVRHDPMGGGLRTHRGIDIPDVAGAPVRAAAGGVVVFAGWSRGYGNLVQIDHGGGSETRYGHLGAIVVAPGTALHQGAVIGLVGSTGRSTGPHLHFEVRENGAAVDPLLRLGDAVAMSSAVEAAAPAVPRWDGYDADATLLPQSRLR